MLLLAILITITLTTVYTCLLFYFIIGSQRLYKKHAMSPANHLPFISVVVPIRNEEAMLLKTLKALAAQDYQGDWEVICVNDRSTDNTARLLATHCKKHPRFVTLQISESEPPVASPKKRALKRGFERSKGSILITTDADCLPPKSWLRSMARNFTEPIGIVQGPKKVIGPNNILTIYQKIETFALVAIEAATFALGKPMLASAPSLAYRKELYEKSGGFDGLEHLVSGDDDMLVHKMAKNHDGLVRYNLDTDAEVGVLPVKRWKALLIQRARWASNGLNYQDKKYVLILVLLYLFYCWMLLSVPLVIFQIIPWQLIVWPFCLKFLLDIIFLVNIAQKLRCNTSIKHIWWAQLIHIPLVVIVVPMGQLKLFKWKA